MSGEDWFHGKLIEICKNFTSLKYTALWKIRNFTATVFSQKFRQINVLLLLKNYCKFIWRNNLCGSEFLVFPYCVKLTAILCIINSRILPSYQNFFREPEVQLFCKKLISRKFCKISRQRNVKTLNKMIYFV